MSETEIIRQKIDNVWEEMKLTGVWKKHLPEWVNEYEKRNIETEHDFSEWLQFVYLPNLFQQAGTSSMISQRRNVVPQAIKFFGEDVKKGKLLQLLIELDSLS